jgi:hypothetical protein
MFQEQGQAEKGKKRGCILRTFLGDIAKNLPLIAPNSATDQVMWRG